MLAHQKMSRADILLFVGSCALSVLIRAGARARRATAPSGGAAKGPGAGVKAGCGGEAGGNAGDRLDGSPNVGAEEWEAMGRLVTACRFGASALLIHCSQQLKVERQRREAAERKLEAALQSLQTPVSPLRRRRAEPS